MKIIKVLFLSILFLIGCNSENSSVTFDSAVFKNLIEKNNTNGNIIESISLSEETLQLVFENTETYTISKSVVISYLTSSADWNIKFELADGSIVNSGYLGNEIILGDINLDPFNTSPLTAMIEVSTPVEGSFKATIKGKNGDLSDFLIEPSYYGKSHKINILGLYPDYENTIELNFISKNGQTRTKTTTTIETVALPNSSNSFPDFDIVIPIQTNENNTLVLMNYKGNNTPFAVDLYGDIRWYSTGFSIGRKFALQRLKNGNIAYAKPELGQGSIIEYSLMGELINDFSFYPEFESAHHDVYEKPDGNFLVLVNKVGISTVEDHVIEMERATGNIINIWDLREILPVDRYTFRKIGDGSDWFHANAVIYDESDDSIIVSGQAQGVVKISRNNELKWILAPHEGWSDLYSPYLLNPILTDDFDWAWGQHAPLLLPSGNLLIFDNGFGRNFGDHDAKYSRIVEYAIVRNDDDIGGSIEQIWEYGKERESEMVSEFISDVDYIDKSFSRFITAGATAYDITYESPAIQLFESDPMAIETRIIEVDINKNILFEMTVISNNARAGSVYRSEKLVIERSFK